jgi:hypothetical protein
VAIWFLQRRSVQQLYRRQLGELEAAT